jgi:hypothetical protein
LADRFPKNLLLASGYAFAAMMALSIMLLPAGIGPLALVFVLGGIQVAIEETLEDSFCAELVTRDNTHSAFGIAIRLICNRWFAGQLDRTWARDGSPLAIHVY